MAQADQVIQNDTFPTVRADINNNLAALFTNSSGNTAPTVTVAYQDWIDTSGTDPVWKKRNAANNAWIDVAVLSGTALTFSNAANVTGTVAIANGGTGQTTATGAINALLPAQAGKTGQVLSTNGSAIAWEQPQAGAEAWYSAYSKAFARVGGGTATYTTNNVEFITSDGTNILLVGANVSRTDRTTFSGQTPVSATDGISGTAAAYGVTTNGTGTWLIATTNGNVWRTTNLVSGSWSSNNVGHTSALTGGVVWTGAHFVALGASGQVRRSTDGLTWSDPLGTSLASSTWVTLLYANGVLTATNNNSTSSTYGWSFDEGATWTTRTTTTRQYSYFVNDRGELIGRDLTTARFIKRHDPELIQQKTGRPWYGGTFTRFNFGSSGSSSNWLAALYIKGYCITNGASNFLFYVPDFAETIPSFLEGNTSETFNVAASGSPAVTALWYDPAQDRVLVGLNNGTYSICTFE